MTAGSPGSTHVVGDVPRPGTSNIVGGTGRLAHATGTVGLPDAADLAQPPTTVGLDCIFVIDLDRGAPTPFAPST